MADVDPGTPTGSDDAAGSELLGALAPYVAERHRSTIGVLIWAFRTGRQLEAWLHDTLSAHELDTSEYAALSALWLEGAPHRLAAGAIADRIVQTSGGTTKTIQRLAGRGLVERIADPEDGRRALVELTPTGLALARSTLDLVLDGFDLEIGDLDEAERDGLAVGLLRLSAELSDRLDRRV